MLAVDFFGLFPGSTQTVGTVVNTDSLQIDFAGGVTSIGVDLYCATSGANLVAEGVVIQLFDTSNSSLGFFSTFTVTTGGVFFGAISDTDLIGRVTFRGGVFTACLQPRAEFVDNISFDAVPEPSALAMGLLPALAFVCTTKRRNKIERRNPELDD